MNYKLLMEMAVLSGELLLSSGAETYRVEDTMNHILRLSKLKTTEAFVIATGFVVTLDDPAIEAMTVVKRINQRNTNLNRICIVNDISRRLCGGVISLEAAYSELQQRMTKSQYPKFLHPVGIIGTVAFFTLILGGDYRDVLFAAVAGAVLAAVLLLADKLRLNSFFRNSFGSIAIAFLIMAMNAASRNAFNTDVVIIGSIMPMVPGVLFTTAIRDTLYGDYLSGCSRMVEAVIVALGVAVGVGAGIAAWQYFF